VGVTPRCVRKRSGVAIVASKSAMRLLMADEAMNSRSLARVMLPSSHTAMNNRSEVGSICQVLGACFMKGGGSLTFKADSMLRRSPCVKNGHSEYDSV